VEFEKATRYFQAGEYEAALPHYERAYTLSDRRPSAIRALAQCERALKLYDKARAHFEEYLATKPKDAAAIQETIALLADLIAEGNRKAAEAKPEAPAAEKGRASASSEGPPEAPKADPGAARTAKSDPAIAPTPLPVDPSRAALEPPTVERSAEDRESGFWSGPIPWIIGGAAIVAGAVAVGFALRSGGGDVYGGSSGVILQR
jgi:tetratricopeptide (TPR) repeat protein